MQPVDSKTIALKDIKSIILAEDDADDRLIFEQALKVINEDAKLTVVSDGKALLQLLQHYMPDFLFLDLDMPYKNGLECLKEIRENKVFEKLPVVVFSSTTRPGNIQTAYEMGANLFFIKPSVYNEYISATKAILNLNWQDPDAVKESYCVNGRYTAFG